MEKLMNVMDFMNKARGAENELINMQRGWEDIRFNRWMQDVFEAENVIKREFTSFEIAALLSVAHEGASSYFRLFKRVEEFITKPFICTIMMVPGRTERDVEFELLDQQDMQPMGKMSYDVNAEWHDKVTEAFEIGARNHLRTLQKVLTFAANLQKLYEEYKDKGE